jgi:ABC-type multidrug transport system ATPase subunit
LAARPPVLLFDEPTNEVDAASIDAFRALVAPLVSIAPRHVVLVTTHHAGDLMSLSPSILPLEQLP